MDELALKSVTAMYLVNLLDEIRGYKRKALASSRRAAWPFPRGYPGSGEHHSIPNGTTHSPVHVQLVHHEQPLLMSHRETLFRRRCGGGSWPPGGAGNGARP